MNVTPRLYRCGQCRARSTHSWAQINYVFGWADLDQRSRDHHGPLQCSVQRCPTCGLCARRIDRASDEFTRAAMESREYAALLARTDLPRLAQTYLLASCVERTRGFAGRGAWFALSAAWVCDDAGNERGATDARAIAVERLREARARKVHLVQTSWNCPPRGTTQFVLIDTLRQLGDFMGAGIAMWGMPELGRNDPPWLVNALAFEDHLIRTRDSNRYKQDDADAWCTRELFAKLPPIRTLRSAGWSLGQNPDERPPVTVAPSPPPPSGVRPLFFWRDRLRFDSRSPISARWGTDYDAVAHIDTDQFECSMVDAINAMFPAMHRRWKIDQFGELAMEAIRDHAPQLRERSAGYFLPRLRFAETEFGAVFASRRAIRAARAARRKAFARAALARRDAA